MIIQIIGCGNMGKLILQSLIDNGVNPKFIYVIVKSKKSKDEIKKQYSVNFGKNLLADIVILGIKPQQIDEIDLKGYGSKTLILSILAGTKIEKIQRLSSLDNVMRVMPNVGLKVKYGVSGFYYSGDKKDYRFVLLNNIFSSLGEFVELLEENMIDVITAISGSGPAYFYYLLELLIQESMSLGFDENTSKSLGINTFLGAAHLLEQSELSPEQLRMMITSKGGTTQKAIEIFEAYSLDVAFKKGVQGAYERAKQLSD